MNPVFTSLVAVVGTLAGSTLTFLFQRHIARQGELFARSQQLWHEKTAAYSALAATLTDFRRSQNDRWHSRQEDPASADFARAREESYQRRADATASLCRVRLVCGDSTLSQLAQDALDAATDVHLAASEQDRAERGQAARLALDRFLAQAASQIL
ncbi:hypothetical protein [Streptomyces purpurogeneiscleroticus]|uniref:hypothetical protein n=1 Tax=Streptomyces purpurogeneiscleroticus TaxID=68259 RepID=UPI001CBC7BB2|nr:hypothetical protein [Streptomyces purpurogeneiscleroticus]MBZ4020129.1 hypothetical protein [Streptomyces purpurogeneiscleroticus]